MVGKQQPLEARHDSLAGSATAARITGLDLLRFIAVMLVLFRHLHPPADGFSGWGRILELLQNGGWVGVDIFFVLSGFLVSRLLFSEFKRRGDFFLGRFLVRRAFKIYPAFWVLIAVTVAVRLFRSHPDLSSRNLVNELLFIQNYGFGLWGHTWSLAVEEHFYLLFAGALFL